MRVALAVPRRHGGGPATVSEALGRGLLERGHRVLLLCNPVSPVRDAWAALDADLAPVLFGRDARWFGILRSWHALRRFRPDVLVGFVSLADDARIFMPACASLGVPAVVRFGLAGALHPLDPLDRTQLARATRLVAVSRQIAEEIERALPECAAPAYIPNGTDVERIRAATPADLGLPPGAPVVGFVGRLHEEKGVFDLLRAWPEVAAAHPRAHLVIVGQGSHEARLRAAAEGLARVRFLGYRSDRAAVHRALDVLALPSYREGLPNVVIEAMAAGVPVVASALDGTREVVEDGVTGSLVPPGDPGALSTALSGLLLDAEGRRAMGEAGYRRALVRHDWPNLLDLWERTLADAEAGGPPA